MTGRPSFDSIAVFVVAALFLTNCERSAKDTETDPARSSTIESPTPAELAATEPEPATDSTKELEAEVQKPKAFIGITGLPADLVRELGLNGQGAVISLVSPKSPGRQAGLKPGDVVRRANQHEIRDFQDLVGMTSQLQAGDQVELEVIHDGEGRNVKVNLEPTASPPDETSYRESLIYLQRLATKPGPRLARELARHHWQLGERGQSRSVLQRAISSHPDAVDLKELQLAWMRMTGDFEQYTVTAKEFASKHKDSPRLQLEYIRSLFGSGQLSKAESETLRAIEQIGASSSESVDRYGESFVVHWILSRCRQGKTLRSAELDQVLAQIPIHEMALKLLHFWREHLADSPALAVNPSVTTTKVELRPDPTGVPHLISAGINGKAFSRLLVDTGAACTCLRKKTATEAGVVFDPSTNKALMGFWEFPAQAGYVKELQIGDITVRNVPVLVGDSFPFSSFRLDGALGMDLMHRLRFTLDYAGNTLHVSRAGGRLPESSGDHSPWDIPVWTFPFITLAEGKFAEDKRVRVALDTGNYGGGMVTPEWAKRNLPEYAAPEGLGKLFSAFSPKTYKLKGLEIAGVPLPEWPVTVTPRHRREFAALFDVWLGYDLLGQYNTTIDMNRRILRLEWAGDEK